MGAYDSLNLDSCETLYAQGAGAVTAPYFAYNHAEKVVAGESCTTGSSSISGLAFYTGDAFPAAYKDALFFSDYSRNCIWVDATRARTACRTWRTRQTFAGRRGRPGVPHRRARTARSTTPTSSGGTDPPDRRRQQRADGADHRHADVRRRAADGRASTARRRPTPRARRSPTRGTSTATAPTTTRPPPSPRSRTRRAGTVTVRLRVTDPAGLTARRRTTITVGAPPTVTIDAPRARPPGRSATRSASPARRATAPARRCRRRAALVADLRHCSRTDANVCHTHAIQDYVGRRVRQLRRARPRVPVAPASCSLTATRRRRPDDDADRAAGPADGGRDARRASPPGLQLSLGSDTLPTPFTRTVIARSVDHVSAPSPQGSGRVARSARWSDGARRHARDHRARVGHGDLHRDVHATAADAASPAPRSSARTRRRARRRAAARSTG